MEARPGKVKENSGIPQKWGRPSGKMYKTIKHEIVWDKWIEKKESKNWFPQSKKVVSKLCKLFVCDGKYKIVLEDKQEERKE